MRLNNKAREWYSLDIDTTPLVTGGWEASFDGGETWVASTEVDGMTSWLVAGPEFDPTGQEPATYVTIENTFQPLLRAIDAPEVVVFNGPEIKPVARGGGGSAGTISSGGITAATIAAAVEAEAGLRETADADLQEQIDNIAPDVPDATDTVKGKVRLATLAEAATGVLDDVSVTPEGLADVVATATADKPGSPIYLAPTGGDDTAAMDAAVTSALTLNRPLVLAAGAFSRTTPWDLRAQGLSVHGQGIEETIITQQTANTAGVRLGHQYQHISGFTIKATTQQDSSQTNSNGIEFYKSAKSVYERIAVNLFARGYMIPQSNYNDGLTSTGNYVFSCSMDTLKVTGFSIIGFHLQAFSAGNTGSVIRNLYVSNNYPGTAQACSSNMVKFANCDEMVIDQLNIEWCTNAATDALSLESCRNTTIRGLHFEGVTMSAFGSALVRPYASRASIDSLTSAFCTFTNSGAHCVVKLSTNNDMVDVRGVANNSNTVSGTYVLVQVEAAVTAGDSYFTLVNESGFTALKSGDAVAGVVPSVKQINDRFYATRNAAGKQIISGTAAPTSGTWAVGDTCWNTAPTAAGTPGWVCTTAGTPGTWKAMAALAA